MNVPALRILEADTWKDEMPRKAMKYRENVSGCHMSVPLSRHLIAPLKGSGRGETTGALATLVGMRRKDTRTMGSNQRESSGIPSHGASYREERLGC